MADGDLRTIHDRTRLIDGQLQMVDALRRSGGRNPHPIRCRFFGCRLMPGGEIAAGLEAMPPPHRDPL
jgi:hypothetical protein